MKDKLSNTAIPNLVKKHIINQIIEKEIKPGERLFELEYSKELGVSRAPIREAFYLLELEGYVTKEPRKGTTVNEFSTEDVQVLLEIRNSLEIIALNKFDRSAKDSSIQEMEKIILEMKQLEQEDIESYTFLNLEFHKQIVKLCKSEVLIKLYLRVIDPVYILQNIYFKEYEIINKSIHDHEQIVKYLNRNDIEKAKDLLTNHNNAVYKQIRSIL